MTRPPRTRFRLIEQMFPRSGRWLSCWLVVLSLVVGLRSAAVLAPGIFAGDPDSYQKVAGELVQHGTFSLDQRPTAYRPPLYPLLIAGVMTLWGEHWRWGLAVVHWALGLATAALAGLATAKLFGPAAALVCVLFVGLDPLLVHSSRLIMTETLSAFLTATVIWLAVRYADAKTPAWGLVTGILLAMCALTRPTFLAWPLSTAIVFLFLVREKVVATVIGVFRELKTLRAGRGGKDRPSAKSTRPRLLPTVFDALIYGTAILIGLLGGLFPWIIRNAAVLGEPVMGTTHGGYTFYLANNEDFYDYLRQARRQTPWDADAFNRRWREIVKTEAGNNEILADQLAVRRAWQVIQQQPQMFAYSCFYRLMQLWRPVPHQLDPHEPWTTTLLRWASGAFYVALYIFALAGLVASFSLFQTRGRQPALTALLCWSLGLILALSLTHTFYWSNIRMRAPLIPILSILAGMGFTTVLSIYGVPKTPP